MTKSELSEQHCHQCGKPIGAGTAAYVHEDIAYCCEGCYLAKLTRLENKHVRDETYLVLVESLAAALDAREHETGLHSKRVACHTQVLARHFTSDKEHLRQVYWGALLHDIGKIAIPDVILLKEGPLTEAEWAVMRSHPRRGHDIVAMVPFLQEAAQIILCHEEHFDGSGYPQGLAGDRIPWGARLFSVIDTLDAITTDRPYRKGASFDVAKEEIVSQAGDQFDPRAVEAMVANEAVLRDMVASKCAAQPDFKAQS